MRAGQYFLASWDTHYVLTIDKREARPFAATNYDRLTGVVGAI
jgi:hypothetical protein